MSLQVSHNNPPKTGQYNLLYILANQGLDHGLNACDMPFQPRKNRDLGALVDTDRLIDLEKRIRFGAGKSLYMAVVG